MPHFRDRESDRDHTTAKYRNWEEHGGDSAPEPFKDLIQRDPVVCDHCFQRRYVTITKDWWRGDPELGWMEYNRWLPIPGRSTEVPADVAAHGIRLACDTCGYVGTKHRPLCAEDVAEFALNICETLDAKGIDHNASVLLREVDRRNTSENQMRQDSHVFAPAVKRAIRKV